MYIIQLFDDNIFYIKNILNNLNNSLKIAEYRNNIIYEDFLKIDNKYFNEYNGDMLFLKKNYLYFIYLESIEYGQINFY